MLPEWTFLCYIVKSANFYWINRKMVLFSLLFLENIFINFLFIFLEAYIDFALQISYWQNWKKFKQKYPSVLEIRIHGKKKDSNFRKKNVSVFLKCPNFSRMSSFPPEFPNFTFFLEFPNFLHFISPFYKNVAGSGF